MKRHEARFLQHFSITADDKDPRGGFNLPSELLEKARSRLSFLTFLFFWFCVIAIGVEASLGSESTRILYAVYLINGVTSAVLFAISRNRRFGHSLVLHLGLSYEVMMCLVVSVGFLWANYLTTGALSEVAWTSILIVMFPLIIPSPPRRTLVTALAAAATIPLGLLILRQAGVVEPQPALYVTLSVTPALCVVVAVAGSRVVYGLNVDVATARQMGSYQLVRLLGKGGMGEVWLAKHNMLARPAAIKLIRPEILGAKDADSAQVTLRRFEREAQATASLHSPHSIGLFDFGTASDGSFFYVMELLEGLALDSLVEQHGPLNSSRVIYLLRQVCHSLEDAHQSGLTHRDIKPANIYVCKMGQERDFVKVLDFGLVHEDGARGAGGTMLTREDVTPGTPAFMAPEMAMGEKELDGRTDLYALGCVGYWLLTGKLVFEGETAMQMALHHLQSTPVPPSKRTEIDIPADLESVILQCLEKNRSNRPRSAAELDRILKQCEPDAPWNQDRARTWWDLYQPALQENRADNALS